MKQLGLFILVGLVMSSALATGQEAYRWVDEKGTIHFADDPTQVPEKYLDQVQKKKFQQEPSTSATSCPRSTGRRQSGSAIRVETAGPCG